MPKGIKGFIKGQSGNPKGRAKGGLSVDDLWKAVTEDDKKNKETFIQSCIRRGRTDSVLAKSILDRICPIPKQPQDINLNSEGCIIKFVFSQKTDERIDN